MVASGSRAPASGCDNQKERKGGKRGEKATVSTHPSTRKQGTTLHMHGYMCKEAISVD